MKLIGNALNGRFLPNLVKLAEDAPELEHIHAAVAYVTEMDLLFDLATKRGVPLSLYALADGQGFPSVPVIRRFVESNRPSWRLFLTRSHYHPKILWFRGVGAYIGSANLTAHGWMSNLECGVWLSQEDLLREDLERELHRIVSYIHARSTAAGPRHLEAHERLREKRKELDRAKAALGPIIDQEPADVLGADRPLLPANLRGGGVARASFLAEWQRGLDILQKLAVLVKDYPWPVWVEPSVHPVIAQDRATEYWYDRNVRRQGEGRIEEFHARNKTRADAAVRDMFKDWSTSDPGEAWARSANVGPRLLHAWLRPDELAQLTEERFGEILIHTHAALEHARQLPRGTRGIPLDQKITKEERCRFMARDTWHHVSRTGRTARDVLQFVIWGDATVRECPERVWDAAHGDDWRLPNLGESILGELVGYARPDEFPPRNGRVGKALTALGYDGFTY